MDGRRWNVLDQLIHRCLRWANNCFHPEVVNDKTERAYRFFEEATELVQSVGITENECHELVTYTFSRPKGEPKQELGGTMNTLLLFCVVHRLDPQDALELEMERIEDPVIMVKVRAKQATKLRYTPLPGKGEVKPYSTIQIIQEKNDNKFPQLETFIEGPELGVTIYGYMDPDVGNIKLNKKQVEELRDNLNSWLETH